MDCKIVMVACHFYDELQNYLKNGERLPVPNVMRCIQKALVDLLEDKSTISAANPTDWGQTTVSAKLEGWENEETRKNHPTNDLLEDKSTSVISAANQNYKQTTDWDQTTVSAKIEGWENEETWKNHRRPTDHTFCSNKKEIPVSLPNRSTTGDRPAITRADKLGNFLKDLETIEECEDKSLYLDIQCLNSTQGVVIKEFAISCSRVSACITIKSPPGAHPVYQDNRYISGNLHGIDWDDGLITLLQLRIFTKKLLNSRTVYVKGMQKVKWMVEQLLVPRNHRIRELPEHPALADLREEHRTRPCEFHSRLNESLVCAQQNSFAIMQREKKTSSTSNDLKQ